MNERIKELREQATFRGHDDGIIYVDDEMLAELIVKECIDAIDAARPYHTNNHLVNDYMNGVEHGHRFAITMIRKHFGVEE